jgi:hypothetical protein
MVYDKKLGIIVNPARSQDAASPITGAAIRSLRDAFLSDLLPRLAQMRNVRCNVFYPGDPPGDIIRIIPKGYTVDALSGGSGRGRLTGAFDLLFGGPNRGCILVNADCPDLPVQYVKRAFSKLKHKDVVAGPAPDGRLYLIGLRGPVRELVDGLDWDRSDAVTWTVEQTRAAGLTLSVLPLWYRADTIETLTLLRDLIKARRLEKSGRFPVTEAALEKTLGRPHDQGSET